MAILGTGNQEWVCEYRAAGTSGLIYQLLSQQLRCLQSGCSVPTFYLHFGLCSLVEALHADGFEVVSLDIQDITAGQRGGVTRIQGDVRDRELLLSAFQGAHIVFHTASYGMSMSAQLQDSLIYAINVIGREAQTKWADRLKLRIHSPQKLGLVHCRYGECY